MALLNMAERDSETSRITRPDFGTQRRGWKRRAGERRGGESRGERGGGDEEVKGAVEKRECVCLCVCEERTVKIREP